MRDALATGKLAGALFPDGSIDPKRADKIWAVTKGPQADPVIASKRREELLERAREAYANLVDFRLTVIERDEAARIVRAASLDTARKLLAFLPVLPEQKDARAFELLWKSFHRSLHANKAPLPPDPREKVGLGEFHSTAELESELVSMRTERMKLKRMLRSGELLKSDDVLLGVVERNSVAQAFLRNARYADCETSSALVRDAVAALACEHVSEDELMGADIFEDAT